MRARLSFLLVLIPAVWAQSSGTASNNVLAVLAGGNSFPSPASGPATSAALIYPSALAVDGAGDILFSDAYFNQVFKVTPAGNISLFAGTGSSSYNGDGGAAIYAAFSAPAALAVDPSGNVYLADNYWNVIRVVNTKGVINTFAGNSNGDVPGTGINGLATNFGPDGLTTDLNGDVYVADNGPGSRTILKINASGTISLISGMFGYHGPIENGAAASTVLTTPTGITADSLGNLYFIDDTLCGAWEITALLQIQQIAGDDNCTFDGDGAATGKSLQNPEYIAFAQPDNLYITDSGNDRVRKVAGNDMTTIAGTGVPGYNGDGIPANTAQISDPKGVAVDSAGNVYFAEIQGRRIRKIDTQGVIHTVAGVGAALPMGDGGLATAAWLLSATGVVSDGKGTFYIADASASLIRKVSPNGNISTIAGTGLPGYNGDGIPATQAQLDQPFALALDSAGNLYVSDVLNERIRVINPQGIISTFAGTGVFGYNGENIPANTAQLGTPRGIALDKNGNLYIAEVDNHRLREVSNGIIKTIAGINAMPDVVPETDSGDGQGALTANFVYLWGVAIDSAGNIYTADYGSSRVRKIGTDGIIQAFAGQTFTFGETGDGGYGTNATLTDPTSVAVDSSGNVYISCQDRIRVVNSAGIINKAVGGGSEIAALNGQLASAVTLGIPEQVWPAPDGTIYFAASQNATVFHVIPGQISREGVQNVADYSSPGYIAPGEIIVMYGNSLGPSTLATPQFTAASTGFPTEIAGTQVLFNGTAAPLLFVESGAIATVVPFEITTSPAHIQVSVNGTMSNDVDIAVYTVEPAQWPSVVNADGTINSVNNPAAAGAVVSFYVTGAGPTSPALTDGQFVEDANHVMTDTVQVIFNSGLATVNYAGAAPGSVAGQMQLVVTVPPGTASGEQPYLIFINGVPATPLKANIYVK